METAAEIPVVHVHVAGAGADEPTGSEFAGVPVGPWSPVDLPRGRRPAPTTIAIVAALAGIGAMALGAAAVLSASRSTSDSVTTVVASTPQAPVAGDGASARAALALLAKPSTERIVFGHSDGRLLLAVGSGGRAAIVMRGVKRAAPGVPYYAWALRPGARPLRVARFVGTERAVFLATRLGPKTSVAVAAGRPGSHYPGDAAVVAMRG